MTNAGPEDPGVIDIGDLDRVEVNEMAARPVVHPPTQLGEG
jgi:hypothetical protein